MKVSAKVLISLLLPVFAMAQNTPPEKLEDSLKAASTDSLRHVIVIKLAGYYAEGNRDLCLKYADIDINLAKRNGKTLDLASALDQKGYELTHERKFTEALSCFDQAKTLAEDPANGNKYWKSDNYPPHINVRLEVLASIYHDLGHLMGATGDMEQKIACYRRAIAIDRQGGSGAIIPYADMNLGSSYLRLGRLDSALILSNKAASLFEKGKDKAYLGLVYLNIGHIYNKKNEREPELLYYHKAEATNFAQHNLTTLAETYLSLSKFYADLKRPDSALFYAKKMMTVARSISVSDFSNAYEVLVACYKLNHQPDSVTKYLGLALAAKDSSYDATVKSLADFQQLSFKTQSRLNALEKEKELSRSRNKMYVLLSAIAVLLILALIFYRNNRQKQKANLLLSEQKEEIEAQRDELEGKNTELEIAAALERVRAVAMSMNKPEDLLNISKALFIELTALHFSEMRNALIQTYFDEIRCFDDYDYSDFSGGHINRIPYKQNSIVDKFLNEIRGSKDAFSEIAITGDDMKKWIEFRASNNETPDERLDHSSSLYYYFYSVGGAAIGISTFAPIPPERLNIVKRFRNVFDLAYKRYTDITKAAAQAREAQIELGLERVRARAMAMHSSEELSGLVATVIAELSKLDLALSWCLITILDEVSWSAQVWRANSQQDQAPQSYHLPFADYPFQIAIMQAWKERQSKWSYVLQGEEKKAIDDYMFTKTDYSKLPPQVQAGIRAAEPAYFYFSFGNFGGLQVGGPKQLSNESLDILARFGRVFDLTYTRFNDLQKAEAQAREAKIEAALEKVRASALAMHHSQDINTAVLAVFEELEKLNLDILRCGIGIIDSKNQVGDIWTTVKLDGKSSVQVSGKEPMNIHPLLQGTYDAWLNQTDFLYNLEGDDLVNYYRAVSGTNFTLPESHSLTDENEGAKQYYYTPTFKTGNLYAFRESPFPDDAKLIMKRFASVLNLTFSRFLDLQKAEAQAREARIETALEKVRSRSLAMYKTEELGEVVNTVFEKLRDLGVNTESDATSIMLFEEGSRDFVQWIAIPGQVNVKSFRIGYIDHPIPNDFFEARERGADFFSKSFPFEVKNPYWTRVFRESDFKSLPEELKQVVLQGDGYSYSVAMGKYSGICIPNFKGNLLSEAENDILKRFARVFEQAYIRFLDLQTAEMNAIQKAEDLKKLQEEKKRTEDALTELRATQKQLIQSEKMASLGELTAGIAHEIQNPLNFVNNFSEVSVELLEELKEEAQAGNTDDVMALATDLTQNLEKIRHHGKRADSIVKGMLEHSRASTGQKQPTNINALAEEYLKLSYHGLRAKDKSFNAELITHFDEELPQARVIAQDIGRVLLNLFNNAFYAVGQKMKTAGAGYKPEVTVTTRFAAGNVMVVVRDNGNGIPDAIKDKIMQPFFTTKPTGEGTGLGLSLSYDIVVKGHGGNIDVDTKAQQYTEFIVTLPLA